ncbi:MAG: respiratory nitrate reductase subunit gamma [Thermofilum sp.]
MQVFSFLLLAVTPYVAVAIFLAGIAYRLLSWLRVPPPAVRFLLHPAPKSTLGSLLAVVKQFLFYPSLMSVNPKLWLATWTGHMALFGALIGHGRLITEYTFVFGPLGMDKHAIDQFSFMAGSIAGLIMLAAFTFLLLRRFRGLLRKLSTPEDYFALSLILGLVITGLMMRFATHIDVEAMRLYFWELATFRPQHLPENPFFMAHYALAQLLLAYFPFGKLMHSIGSLLTNSVTRWKM